MTIAATRVGFFTIRDTTPVRTPTEGWHDVNPDVLSPDEIRSLTTRFERLFQRRPTPGELEQFHSSHVGLVMRLPRQRRVRRAPRLVVP